RRAPPRDSPPRTRAGARVAASSSATAIPSRAVASAAVGSGGSSTLLLAAREQPLKRPPQRPHALVHRVHVDPGRPRRLRRAEVLEQAAHEDRTVQLGQL